ncbi:hypothetical protein NC653_009275 [Populus alba x Populus x berolinensis]|uniref:AB hydrolase-1 domain-containing protein n=1 Tax=Populus alba x Populus x berolinensis TaxID=444605 RepID=A0AAD6R8Q1_9ROSI|nr:hypothetical protein NC653_009275 [Populus alba x Populus x berolinensis]
MPSSEMAVMGKTIMILRLTGRVLHDAVSFIVFSLLDILDLILCFAFKAVDFIIEAEWKPCYCTSAKEVITSSGKIFVSEQVSEISRSTVNELKRFKVEDKSSTVTVQSSEKNIKKGTTRSTFTVNSTIVGMLRGKIGGQQLYPIPRWSDCDCKFCTSWTTSSKETLFVRAEGPRDKAKEDVLFVHGFISSSAFWTETLFPNFSNAAKSTYRLFAIDLLGFGRSPKPADSLYTLREHLDMIEQSVLEPYKVKSFHIVAHSLGCILALALAVKHPGSVKTLTLLAPPYYKVPKGVQATQHVMKQVAPRRVWPLITFGASIACWYEHITRAVCLVLSKNHRLWEFLTKLVTRNRMRTFLIEGFFCHTHNAAWHTLHNIICGTGSRLDGYLDSVRDHLKCDVNIFHGRNDELIPVECSYNVQQKVPRAKVKVIDGEDHITIVVNRQKVFARELEEIWRGGDRVVN